eukprot:CAMPEP_0204390478 /NCGR_PEP_ID=MMETSP0469-20131031/60730_1 /ASSEMBLY_ACC=CAM_ASM_000384 /TAXON_ID=2969 /ORGANISM="Oxyrrhis marina" /LENGTH=106 /DNA_ID=CAMNT_0051384359 /DNA_START=39 /DNA_END=355 /DNA_ORIENTATION=+
MTKFHAGAQHPAPGVVAHTGTARVKRSRCQAPLPTRPQPRACGAARGRRGPRKRDEPGRCSHGPTNPRGTHPNDPAWTTEANQQTLRYRSRALVVKAPGQRWVEPG